MVIDNKIIFTCIAGFIAGVFFDSILNLGFTSFILSLLVAISVYVYNTYLSRKIIKDRFVIFIALAIFSFGLGILRFEIKDIRPTSVLSERVKQVVELKAIVSDEPQDKDNYSRLVISALELFSEPENIKLDGEKLIISTDLYPKYEYGDIIFVKGKLEVPENFESESGNIFDYVEYLAKDDIYFKIDFAKVEKVGHNPQSVIKEKLFKIKNYFLGSIRKYIHEPESALLAGLLLGDKDSMGADLEENFRRVGVSHIVVLSGYNITIIAESVLKVFSFLPLNISLFIATFFVILFAIMTGGSSTVVRASIMAIIVILARFSHRNYDIKRALIFAGLIMVIINPKILVFDSSFQLSFLATIALIYVVPIVSRYLTFVTERFGIREIISATISTQIFVLPLIIFKMGEISLVSLPTNLLVLLFVPLTMLFGFLTAIFAPIWGLLAKLFSFIAYGLLHYELSVINFFAKFPFSMIKISGLGPVILFFSYIILVLLIWYANRNIREEVKE